MEVNKVFNHRGTLAIGVRRTTDVYILMRLIKESKMIIPS